MQSVRELCAALSDSASRPRYIETIHGRGYRWIGERPIPVAPITIDDGRTNSESFLNRTILQRGNFDISVGQIALAVMLSTVFLIVVASFVGKDLVRPGVTSTPADRDPSQDVFDHNELVEAQRIFENKLSVNSKDLIARAGLVSVLYRKGAWSRAVEIGETAPLEVTSSDRLPKAEIHLTLGQIQLDRGNSKDAELHFQAAREQASDPNESTALYVASLRGLSQVYADQRRIADYLSVRNEAIDPMLIDAQLGALAEGLLSAGTTVRPTFDHHWDLERLTRARAVFEKLDDTLGMARSHAALGLNRALSEQERRQHLESASKLYLRLGHLPGEMSVQSYLASLETEWLNGEAAIDAVLRFRTIAERLDTKRELAAARYTYGLAQMARH